MTKNKLIGILFTIQMVIVAVVLGGLFIGLKMLVSILG